MSQQLTPETARSQKMLEPYKRGGRHFTYVPGHSLRGFQWGADHPRNDPSVQREGQTLLRMPSGKYRYAQQADTPSRQPPDWNNGLANHLITLERAQQLKYPLSSLNILRTALRTAKRNLEQGHPSPTFEAPPGYLWLQPYSLDDIEGPQYMRQREVPRPAYRPEEDNTLQQLQDESGKLLRQPAVGQKNERALQKCLSVLAWMCSIEDDSDDAAMKEDITFIRVFPKYLDMLKQMLSEWWDKNGMVAEALSDYGETLRMFGVNYPGDVQFNILMDDLNGLDGPTFRYLGRRSRPDELEMFTNWINGGVQYDIYMLHKMLVRVKLWFTSLKNRLESFLREVQEGLFVPRGSPPLPEVIENAIRDNDIIVHHVNDDEEEELIDTEGDEYENYEEEEEDSEN